MATVSSAGRKGLVRLLNRFFLVRLTGETGGSAGVGEAGLLREVREERGAGGSSAGTTEAFFWSKEQAMCLSAQELHRVPNGLSEERRHS